MLAGRGFIRPECSPHHQRLTVLLCKLRELRSRSNPIHPITHTLYSEQVHHHPHNTVDILRGSLMQCHLYLHAYCTCVPRSSELEIGDKSPYQSIKSTSINQQNQIPHLKHQSRRLIYRWISHHLTSPHPKRYIAFARRTRH